MPVPKINIIYLLLHAIYLNFQIFIHGQSAIIIEYLENKKNVYYAQEKKKNLLFTVNHELPFHVQSLCSDSPRFTVTFKFAQCQVKDIFYSFIICFTDNRIDTSEKGFI